MTIRSPCTGMCLVDHDAARCTSCGRSLAEIAAWLGMSDARREAIMRCLAERRADMIRAQLPPQAHVAGG